MSNYAGPLYLRDLKPEMQEELLETINNNPKLKKAYENGEDIQVGQYYHKFEIA